ncbi:YHS domain-containing (seleno)protein [Oceanibium sediminis]|uniref:YHS domain-containing (seleno)protein n=1 Tax=Oceanibium sediminis TaxID=2026339 RepID=UPI000DD46885|nr:YHS domain-containing (seleno)protein [Oceanibium sediminis]
MTLPTRRHALALIGLLAAAPALGFQEPVFLNGMGIAIAGYDPVTYHENQEARRGSIENELETDDGLWWFVSEEHRALFEANPEKYTPAFGGYDAQGIAKGFKRRSDPTVWVMIDDRIYLHYSIPDQNLWAKDIRGNIALGNENWEHLRDQ